MEKGHTVYIAFWVDSHFLQDQANFWETDLFGHVFHVTTSPSAKNKLDPARNENSPFCMKAFN